MKENYLIGIRRIVGVDEQRLLRGVVESRRCHRVGAVDWRFDIWGDGIVGATRVGAGERPRGNKCGPANQQSQIKPVYICECVCVCQHHSKDVPAAAARLSEIIKGQQITREKALALSDEGKSRDIPAITFRELSPNIPPQHEISLYYLPSCHGPRRPMIFDPLPPNTYIAP